MIKNLSLIICSFFGHNPIKIQPKDEVNKIFRDDGYCSRCGRKMARYHGTANWIAYED